MRDLYSGRDVGTAQGEFTALVDPHDVCAVKLTPEVVRPEYDRWRPWHQAGLTIDQARPADGVDGRNHGAAADVV